MAELENEIWLPVIGYEGFYEVSSLSRIRSIDRTINEGGKGAYFAKGVLLKPGLGGTGYYTVALCGKSYKVHRLIAIAFITNPQAKKFINHKNGIKTDNRVENLEWVTSQENNIHALKHGLKRKTQGEMLWTSKLTEDKIREIRRLNNSGEYQQKELAQMFSISACQINGIVNNKYWKSVV